jgi:hypothetical protein
MVAQVARPQQILRCGLEVTPEPTIEVADGVFRIARKQRVELGNAPARSRQEARR